LLKFHVELRFKRVAACMKRMRAARVTTGVVAKPLRLEVNSARSMERP
jgi:hypothetical protein